MKNKKVIIEGFYDGTYGIYSEDGQCVEGDFFSYESAANWAILNGFIIVSLFNLYP